MTITQLNQISLLDTVREDLATGGLMTELRRIRKANGANRPKEEFEDTRWICMADAIQLGAFIGLISPLKELCSKFVTGNELCCLDIIHEGDCVTKTGKRVKKLFEPNCVCYNQEILKHLPDCDCECITYNNYLIENDYLIENVNGFPSCHHCSQPWNIVIS